MKLLLLILPLLLLAISCKKETLKTEENFNRCLGLWHSINNSANISINFLSTGEIIACEDLNRSINFIPNKVFLSPNPPTNWTIIQFYNDKKNKYKDFSLTLSLNNTNDSMTIQYKSVINQVASAEYSTLLIKQK